jgi:hypothetical protein
LHWPHSLRPNPGKMVLMHPYIYNRHVFFCFGTELEKKKRREKALDRRSSARVERLRHMYVHSTYLLISSTLSIYIESSNSYLHAFINVDVS